MTKQKIKNIIYNEGDWFGVPLDNGSYGIGLITRRKKSGRGSNIIFGYFFGPRRESLPLIDELRSLVPLDAILICKFGDLGLFQGSWPIIGHFNDWDRTSWPMPPLVRVDAISGKATKVIYDENDLSRMPKETTCDLSETHLYPEDSLYGAGAVEAVLSDKFRKNKDGHTLN